MWFARPLLCPLPSDSTADGRGHVTTRRSQAPSAICCCDYFLIRLLDTDCVCVCTHTFFPPVGFAARVFLNVVLCVHFTLSAISLCFMQVCRNVRLCAVVPSPYHQLLLSSKIYNVFAFFRGVCVCVPVKLPYSNGAINFPWPLTPWWYVFDEFVIGHPFCDGGQRLEMVLSSL